MCLVSYIAHKTRRRDKTSARYDSFLARSWEAIMLRFIHEQKLLNYRKLIAASEIAPIRNEVQHAWLLKLLAEELAKGVAPLHELH
jgi:hypothetical protein